VPNEGEAGYQRGFEPAWARRIAKEFTPKRWRKPEVARRSNGLYTVVDGQHRLAALRILYPDQHVSVLCDVVALDGPEEEAERFLAVNHYTRKTTAQQTFKALLVAGDQRAWHIHDLFVKYGYAPRMVSQSKQRDGELSVAAAERILRQHGLENWGVLDESLRVIRAAYGDNTSKVGNALFSGIGSFIATYQDNPNYDVRRLITVLNRLAPDLLTRDAYSLRIAMGTSHGIAARRMIASRYNQKLREHNRLPEV
jgi:hypothetical protein